MTVGVCQNCGRDDDRLTKGLCRNCYRYQYRHGKPRPLDERARMQRTKHPTCINCGAQRVGLEKHRHGTRGARGMCNACYRFWVINGRMRTEKDMIRSWKSKPGFCKNCKESAELYRGLCATCWAYKSKSGKSRPFRLYRQECSNCAVPFNGYKPHKGRCRPCQNYFGEHGKERPDYMWKSEHGWCECGTGLHPVKATHTVQVRVQSKVEDMHLCDDCYKEHQRQVAWYGAHDVKVNNSAQHSTR